jgi:hypothetical protein
VILKAIHIFIFSFLACVNAHAKGSVFGPEFGKGGEVTIEQITHYMPTKNDSMQGRCGGGGGTAPKDPCKHLLEDAVAGKTPCAVAATQRHGGSAPLYGCQTVVPNISKVVGKDVNICFADVYAASQSEGKIFRGKKMPSKFDLAVKEGSKFGPKIQQASANAEKISCNGRIDNTQNKSREIERNPEATSPMAGAPGGGGGAPPAAQQAQPGSPPAAYPEALTGATSPTPASNNTSVASKDTGVKIGIEKPEKKETKATGDSPSPDSGITKNDGRVFPTALTSASEEALNLARAANGGAGSKPASASVGSSGGGGLGDSSSSSRSSGGSEFKPIGSLSQSEGGSNLGGGGGGGGGGNSFSSPNLAEKKPGEPAIEAALGNETEQSGGEVAEAAAEESRDPASEVVDGVGSKYGASVFDRVHSYFERKQKGRAR